MQKKIYLTGIERRPGKSFISLGLAAILHEQFPDLCCFKLFSEEDNAQTPILEKITQQPVHAIMSINQAISMLRDQPEDLFSRVLDATSVESTVPLCYWEGSDFQSDNELFEYQFNLSLASQLGCDVILVISAKERTIDHTASLLTTALEVAKKNHTRIIGAIINQVLPKDESNAQEVFARRFKQLPFVVIMPEFEALAHPSVQDIARTLKAELLCGEQQLNRSVRQFTIGAKTVGHFLESRLERENMLIITPDDRVDILLGSLLADQSAFYPKIAGIVLTGGEKPGPIIQDIIDGLENPFPVLLTSHKTYETATMLFSAKYGLTVSDPTRIDLAINSMKPFLSDFLTATLKTNLTTDSVSLAVFLHGLMRQAKQKKRHIVLPEGDDPRILIAAEHIAERQLAELTILGQPDKIQLMAKRLGLKLPQIQLLDIEQSEKRQIYAQRYFELRQHKNVNLPIALERMTDPNYFAAMMVYCQDADGMVSGAAHTTADTVRPALEIIKTKPGVTKVSSVFIMCLATRVLIYGDCAINPEPDSATLAEIALQASQIAQKLGITPRVALLSYSSGDSGKGGSVDKVAHTFNLLKKEYPNLQVEGPIQYDAAVDPEVALKKLPHSKIAGRANVLIFPDLNTGNNTYKAVQRETGALAIGPILLGLNKPVNDLSRGCTPQDIINTILITALQVEDYA